MNAHLRFLTQTRLYLALFCCVPTVLAAQPSEGPSARQNLDSVRLQLKWKHQFQFAGYYAAVAKGYYREAGLAVEIREADQGQDPIRAVLDGRAEFGVGTTDLLLLREQGEPVVALAVIFQHSPLALLARRDADIDTLHDLAGRRVMIEPNSAELFAYLQREGLTSDTFTLQHHTFSVNDLTARKADAMSVYTTDEPFALVEAQVPYRIFSPRAVGIDFYGDNLFTTEGEIEKHPARVAAFRAASLAGWDYALAHTEEIIRLIHDRYSDRHSIEHLRYEAQKMQRLMPSLVQTGHMNPGRWKNIAEVYAEQGMMKPGFDLSGFLYDPDPRPDFAWLYWTLFIVVGLALVLGGLAFYVLGLNRHLRVSEERFRLVYETAPLALILWDQDQTITDWNRGAEKIFGWSARFAVGRNLWELLLPAESRPEARDKVRRLFETGEVDLTVVRNLTSRGDSIVCEWTSTLRHDGAGKITGALSLALDVTERRELEKRLSHLAHYDSLTDLPNRALFFERLSRAFASVARGENLLGLLFIDLDGFKPINDSYGHETGDAVLKAVARRFEHCLAPGETVARMGGDEFAVILPALPGGEVAARTAEKILNSLEAPIVINGYICQVGASIGIALYPGDSDMQERLVSLADKAMYISKTSGKNTYTYYRPRKE